MGVKYNAALVFAGLIQVVVCFDWKNPATLQDNATIPACPGQDVDLDWDYTRSLEETILVIEWRYLADDGTTEETLATQVNGHFFPDPDFVQRLSYIPEAGIRLLSVRDGDSGTYSVHVNVDLHGSVTKLVQSIYLDVTESSEMTNGSLHARFEGARHVNSTQDHHLIFSCGTFNPVWVPKIDVVWTTPGNQTLPSTFHDDTTFYLAVPNPYVSGQYTCSIDNSSPAMVCIESDSPLRRGATASVEALQGRVALIDSEMQYLREHEAAMQSQIDYLKSHSIDVRLVDGYNGYEGRVEARLRGRSNDTWGTVCDDNWTMEDAGVVCRQLGLPSANARAWGSGRFGQGSGSIVMDSVNCSGSESSLLDCSFASGQNNCGHQHDVGVTCGFELRLAREQNSHVPAGIPEVKMGLESWGAVCGNGFTVNEAKVICRHLGLPSDIASVWRSTTYDQGRGPVLMNNLNCNGSESNLLDCSFNFGQSNCYHEHDVGVTCGPCSSTDLDCDFDQGLCNYRQLTDDDFDWTRNHGPTGSTNTGPSSDHTRGSAAGYYVYIETSSPRTSGETARLSSPSVTDGQPKCLTFWYHMHGTDINTLNVYTKMGSTYGNPVWTHQGEIDNSWHQANVSLSNANDYSIVFEGVSGSHYYADIAVDDISVLCGACP